MENIWQNWPQHFPLWGALLCQITSCSYHLYGSAEACWFCWWVAEVLELHVWRCGHSDFPVAGTSSNFQRIYCSVLYLGSYIHHGKSRYNSICACSKTGDLIAMLVLLDGWCMTTCFEVPGLQLEWRIFSQDIPALCNTACKLLIRVLSKNSFHLLKYNYMHRQWQIKMRARQKPQLAF